MHFAHNVIVPEEFDTYQHHFHKYKNEKGEPVKNKFGEISSCW